MCDRCEIDLLMYGETKGGFRCSDVAPDLLEEEANGIARFPNRKKAEAPKEKPAEPGGDPDEMPRR